MPYTFFRVQPFTEVMGADAEKLFGVGGVVGERLTVVAAAGVNTILGAIVPAGSIWVVTFACMVDTTTFTSGEALSLVRPVVGIITIARNAGLVFNLGLNFSGQLVLAAGDRVTARFEGCVAGDNLQFCYAGYLMVAP